MKAQIYIYLSLSMIMYCSATPWGFAEENANAISSEASKTTNTVETDTAQQVKAGEKLFKSICAHCHNTTYDESRIGAPGLRGVIDRHDEAWLNQWIKSPETFAKKDVAARDLIDSNRFGLAMPTIPAMQDDANRMAVIEYLKTLK
jgi:cytochrome c2